MTERPASQSYRLLLADRRIASVIAAVTVGRLAAGMVPFGMIAAFTSERELGWAGASFAAFLLGAAVSGPYKGALIDRFGAYRLLLPMALAFTMTASGAALLAAYGQAALYPVALVLTATAAVLAPPNSAVLRTVWTEIARSDAENTRLHSLDSVAEEAIFVVAPLLTSGIWLLIGAHWAVVTGGLCALVGTVWFRGIVHMLGADRVLHGSSRAGGRSGAGRPRAGGLFFSRNGVAVFVPMAALGLAMGALSVGYPAWALERFHVEFAGVLAALDSVGGIVAGLIYGRLAAGRPRLWWRYFGATAILAAGVVVVAVGTSVPVVVLGSLLVGAALTPMYIIAFVLVGAAFPADRHTAVNAGIGSVYNLGSGLAAPAAGAALGAWHLTGTFLVVAGLVLVLGTTALLGRAVVASPPDPERDSDHSTPPPAGADAG